MKRTRSQKKAIGFGTKRKRKREVMGKCGNKKRLNYSCGIDELPDDILIIILSCMSLNESARASALARRWRYLWRSSHDTLRFDDRDTLTGNLMKREKFESWVNDVMELYQARYVEGVVIRFEEKRDRYRIIPSTYDSWMYFAIQKEVQRFELNLPFNDIYDDMYRFPSVERLITQSHCVSPPFCHLRTLRLAHVGIEDEVVHYFLALCLNLEELCIHSSNDTRNLQVIRPPRLRVLEISRCSNIQTLIVSAMNLVSLTYRGPRDMLLMEKVPNLRELTICDDFCISFVTEPLIHWNYSVHLEKLVLDFRLMDSNSLEVLPSYVLKLCSLKRLEVFAVSGRTLLVFTPLIEASPQLREFRIERMSYSASWTSKHKKIPFRGTKAGAKTMEFVHKTLKVVEVGGYTGCRSEEELVLALIKIGPSIEKVVIDTKTDDFGLESCISLQRELGLGYACLRRSKTTTRNRAKERAKDFATKIPRGIKFIVA